ncbi:hypothetical protein GF385_00535 [Candidatus Dependentiae bacterium]|nr:hypothetical protein [Candidatus Dependentiae bacterium]
MIDSFKPKIKLSKYFFFKEKKPKEEGNQLVIPGKSEFVDYLFFPCSYPINLDGHVEK